MKLTIGVICEGGGSWANHTGDWRTFRPFIDDKICNGCGLCVQYCPESSLQIIEDKVKVDLRYCKGCSICKNECAQDAITMVEENGEG